MQGHRKLTMICCAAVLSLGLAACGGGGSDTAMEPPPPPPPTPYETAVANIAAAGTAAEAQAAYDAVKDDVTAAQGARLQAAVDSRVAMLTTAANAAMQRADLMTAAGNVDTSDLMDAADIAAANTAIAALKAAIAAAVDVDDTSMYDAQVTAAEAAVAAAQLVLDRAAQMTALTDAIGGLQAIDLTALSTQEAIDAAQGAIDALQAALDGATDLSATEKTAAMTELATADRTVMMAQGRYDTAAQKTALADAAATLAGLDLDNLMTQEQIDAAVAAITGLNLALEAATNLTDAEKLDATVDATVAQRKVDRAEDTLTANVDSQRTALMEAVAGLDAIDLDDLDTAEKIAAANAAIMALQHALNGATHLSDAEKSAAMTDLDTATETVRTAQTGMDRDGRMTAQRTAITNAVTAARTAVGMVDDDATDAEVKAADDAVAALKAAIEGADDLPEGDTDVASAEGTLTTLEGQLASAKTSRTAAIAAKQTADDKAMAATAAKLYDGISAQMGAGDGTTFAETDRDAYYNNDGTAILVSIGDGTNTPTAVSATLSEDKKTTVAVNHGWTGKKYADPAGGDSYEAVVYSNVGEPTMGAKFNSGDGTGGVGFALTDGALTLTDALNTAARVTSPSFDHGAGYKTFKLPDPNLSGADIVTISGSYYGVAGTYACTPTVAADGCRVNKAATGYTLALTGTGGGSWTFTPTNAEARVTEMPDSDYASYGWWLRTDTTGDLIASAFVDDKGAGEGAASGLNDLNGTATYQGGAAGKYALSSSTGGTNDAGHFTARATLNADFSKNVSATGITGTIDQFKVGDDGEARDDWEVELMGSAIGDAGLIRAFVDGTPPAAASAGAKTKWTIGGTAADPAGEWSGTLYDNGDDGVPKVGTGTFYTEYGTAGRMVGAFGVNKE